MSRQPSKFGPQPPKHLDQFPIVKKSGSGYLPYATSPPRHEIELSLRVTPNMNTSFQGSQSDSFQLRCSSRRVIIPIVPRILYNIFTGKTHLKVKLTALQRVSDLKKRSKTKRNKKITILFGCNDAMVENNAISCIKKTLTLRNLVKFFGTW